ncbi:MAG: hypothetical protein IPO91_34305 [Chloroflexi bacterium]|nr:hypothetical protein [Chloroflexota bacterium]
MASYAENTVYIKLDSTEVDAFFKDVSPTASNSTVDITAGSGTDWNMRAAGLNDISFSITLMYDAANVQTYIQKIAPGSIVTLEYGPEDAVSGKPRHVQSCIVSSVDHSVTVNKDAVTFSITLDGADAPSVNMFAGGVYS